MSGKPSTPNVRRVVIGVLVKQYWRWLAVGIIGYTVFIVFWVITIMHFTVEGVGK